MLVLAVPTKYDQNAVQGGQTNYKDPSPTFHSVMIVHGLADGRHHDTSKHGAHLANGSENGCSLRDFLGFTIHKERVLLVDPSRHVLVSERTTKIQ